MDRRIEIFPIMIEDRQRFKYRTITPDGVVSGFSDFPTRDTARASALESPLGQAGCHIIDVDQ